MLLKRPSHNQTLLALGMFSLPSSACPTHALGRLIEHLEELDIVDVVDGLFSVGSPLQAPLLFQVEGTSADLGQVAPLPLSH